MPLSGVPGDRLIEIVPVFSVSVNLKRNRSRGNRFYLCPEDNSAVHAQYSPGDEIGLIGCRKKAGIRDVPGLPDTAKRGMFYKPV